MLDDETRGETMISAEREARHAPEQPSRRPSVSFEEFLRAMLGWPVEDASAAPPKKGRRKSAGKISAKGRSRAA